MFFNRGLGAHMAQRTQKAWGSWCRMGEENRGVLKVGRPTGGSWFVLNRNQAMEPAECGAGRTAGPR